MKLFALVTVTMVAFAGNSILTRLGVFAFGMDPMQFAVTRVAAGAVTLVALVWAMGGRVPLRAPRRIFGASALAVYMVGFSWAYLRLDAGLGALILFGVLQIAMFSFAVVHGQGVPLMRWLGATLALIGLCVLLWPTQSTSIHFASALSMIVAGLAWAAYTLLGQGEPDALAASAGNFVLCLPLAAVSLVLASEAPVSLPGALTAIASGAITSGLGYALWYRVLPQLATTSAAIAQLSVPVIAVVAGVLLLGEPLTQRLLLAGALVIGGIALSLRRRT